MPTESQNKSKTQAKPQGNETLACSEQENAPSTTTFSPALNRWLPWLTILFVWLIFCGPMMCGQTVVGFRDSANLYYPLFQSLDEVWQTGTVPFFNPYCNFGFPTVADGSSSVFYPGKLVFACRFLDFPARYGIYLSVHLLLAAIGTFLFARRLRCGRPGATLAAISFAFGAPVLFQTTNVIYLVSAAWLPLALLAVWQMLTCRGKWSPIAWAIVGAVCCSMMFLGGDPQMVYHIGLIATASVATIGIAKVLNRWRQASNDSWIAIRTWIGKRFAGLAVLVVVTSLLSAIQLIPTAELAQRSERSGGEQIANLYSALMQTATGQVSQPSAADALLRTESQVVGQYQFSQPPWSVLELALPNVSGKPFPLNARWTSQLVAADRMWYPSIYLGALTLLLSIGQFRLWGHRRRNVWLSWITLWFLLASFGWYGAIWLIHETQLMFGSEISAGAWAAPTGGAYWWMSTLLPSYFSFRYPAKLFIIASLGLCILAGQGTNLVAKFKPSVLLISALFTITAANVAVELWLRDFLCSLDSTSSNSASMPEFGPFDPSLAATQIYEASFHLAIVLALTAGCVAWLRKSSSKKRASASSAAIWCLIALVAVDLIAANRWMLAEVSSDTFTQTLTQSSDELSDPATTAEASTNQPTVVIVDPSLPYKFVLSSSSDRLREIIVWQRQTYQAKHHLPDRVRLIGSFHSIWPTHYLEAVNRIRLSGDKPDADPLNELHWGQNPIQSWQLDWNKAEFVVQMDRAGEIELPLFGDGHWQATITNSESKQTTPLKASSIRVSDQDLLEVALPEGIWKIELQYVPRWFYSGAIISGCAWLIVLILAGRSAVAQHRDRSIA